MMKENEDGGVYPWSQWTAGGGLLCAAARGLFALQHEEQCAEG